MKRKSFAILSMVAIAGLVLVACGTATTVAPTTEAGVVASPTTAAVAASPTTKPVEMVTIRWRTRPDNQAEQDVYQAISDDLSKQLAPQGIKLQYDPSPVTGYLDKLTTELSAGTAPDLFWIPGASVADYAIPGTLLDLAPIAAADTTFKASNYYDAPMKEVQQGGHLWGLPRDISTLVMYYNKDLFAAKGVDDPIALKKAGKWDWENFLRVATALTDPAKKTYGFSMSDWWGVWGYFIYAAGGDMYNTDRTGCGLTTPEAQAGLQFLQDIFNKYKVATPPGMEGGVGETEFIAGQAGMYPNGRWMTPGMRTNAKYNWDVVEMPKGKVNSTWLFWGAYVIAKTTKHPDQAWAVLKALTSPEVQAKVAVMGSSIPSNKGQAGVDAFLASKPPENNQAFLSSAATAQAEIPLFHGNFDAIVNGVYQPAIDKILSNKGTVADITKGACEAANKLFKK
jgi:multiple sugar transport system substrate-binding protein